MSKNRFIRLVKDMITFTLTRVWWYFPISREQKEAVKGFIFTFLGWFFKKFNFYPKIYRNWYESRVWTHRIDARLHENPAMRVKKFTPEIIAKLKYKPESIPTGPFEKVAVILHIYHFEILDEIMHRIRPGNRFTLSYFITAPVELCDRITKYFVKGNYDYRIMPVDNRGRDILPFLKIVPLVLNMGFQVILKIHTKKSDHRKTGELWRKDLYNKLLNEKNMLSVLDIFNADLDIGLVGARGHVVPMKLYYGANAARLEFLSWEMGVTTAQMMGLNFPAGSMFYIRRQALLPLLNLELKESDFEAETGQVDGTLAHSVERAFAVSTFAAGLKFVDSSYHPVHQETRITKDHPYTF